MTGPIMAIIIIGLIIINLLVLGAVIAVHILTNIKLIQARNALQEALKKAHEMAGLQGKMLVDAEAARRSFIEYLAWLKTQIVEIGEPTPPDTGTSEPKKH